MPCSRQLVSALAAVAFTSVEAAMGPAFSTGPVAANSWIREATSTLVLPKAPSGSSGDTSLWVGMGTSNGDLIQSIADNWQASNWNVFAYTLTHPNYKNTMAKSQGVTGDMSTSDGGKTWIVSTIKIPQFTFGS